MATVAMAPGLPVHQSQSDETLSTLPDPRSPLTSPELSRSSSTSSHHPELSNEVAALSNKLIHAINHQTDLEDSLNATRHELESAQVRVRQLEPLIQEHKSLVTNGILVRQTDVEAEILRLKTSLADERRQRVKAESDKMGIEQELENLTTALFEEANQMVSAARKDARKGKEPLERRNEQLQVQLNDAELLLASHQEQLAELKIAMQDMTVHRTDLEASTNASTAPSTPAPDNQDHLSKIFDALNLSPTHPGGDEIPPAPPTSFTHLLQPVLRMDLQAYEDFHALLEMSRKSQPSSRVTSGNYGSLNGLGLGNLTNREQSQIPDRMPSNGSTSSLSASNIHHSSPNTTNLPASTNSSFSSRDTPVSGTPLKETLFYKRALTEDIEPTLRLDLSPGLSWLARRTVINSMCEGRLIVEPTPPAARLYHPPCSLCGEQGRGDKQARMHRFRTSESESAQRYPLCKYCLTRMRATCDFLSFLRMIKDGYWRTDGAQAEAIAWEESVRLRERMFWSRIGGGVVPAFLRAREDTPRSSTEDNKPSPSFADSQTSLSSQDTKLEKLSHLVQEINVEQPLPLLADKPASPSSSVQNPNSEQAIPPPKDITPSWPLDGNDPAQINGNRPSLSRTPTHPRGLSLTESTGRGSVARRAAMFEKGTSEDGASRQLQTSLQDSVKSRSPVTGRSPSPAVRPQAPEPSVSTPQHERDTSGTIPGSFDF
ncbi:MAG: rab guanine nucleotide exchange factor S2 [Alectoria sarmentosa]|nr:MAG: rab guanine nucleotide exchange factor S2 [Alectoria sarmentosa]